MQDEKRKILEMVANKEISQEDALRLLDALEATPVDKAFSSAMSELREDPTPPPPGPGPAIPYKPQPQPQKEGDIWDEVNNIISQTAAGAAEALSEGVQWAKGAVKKIPGLHAWWGDGEGLPPGEEPVPYNQQEKTAAIGRLEIEWVNGPVEITSWDGDWVNVTEYAQHPLEEEQQLELVVTDKGTMRIRWTKGRRFWKDLGLSKYLLVQLPEGLELDKLKVENISGLLRAQGFSCRDTALHTTSGKIEAAELSAQELELHSVSGKLLGEHVKAGRGSFKTTSGKVEAKAVQADELKLSSVSGKVYLEDVSAGLLEAGSTSGTLEAAGFGCQKAKLSTVSGAIKAYGNGEKLAVKSVSGRIRLQTQEPARAISGENGSGHISLVLPEGYGFEARYDTVSGNFSTELPVGGELGGKSGRVMYSGGGTEITLHTLSGKMDVAQG